MFYARRRLLIGTTAVGSVYALDELYWYKVVQRSLRAGGVGLYTIVNYKFFWSPDNASKIHTRVAKAITNCCLENEGLYVKIGQAINSLAAILPKEYTENLTQLLDRAKTYDFQVIQGIIDSELGEEVVRDLEPIPAGSASLAQVHRGVLAETGQLVAVKVQKPNVSMQAFWDLWMYRILVRLLEYSFDIPLYWAVGFTTSHFMAELDFRREGANSELAREQLSHLGDVIYVPKVLRATEKVLVTEWVEDAVMISDVKRLREKGFDCKSVILDATKIFGYQVFHTGHVHADPHFGNLLIRSHPSRKGKHQVVLIDHGLYVEMPPKLRHEYARLWVAIVPPRDTEVVEEICREWGIGNIDLFQAIIRQGAQKSDEPNELKHEAGKPKRDARETGVLIKSKLKELLQDTNRFPKELILVGRCMNYIRAANWSHGSPIDRISVLAQSASDALKGDANEAAKAKGWLISSISAFFRYTPGGREYNSELDKPK
jgi:aarF domain-containing kinase